MTTKRMIELLEIEHKCMLRKSHGDCDGDCENCDLVQDDMELHEMYINVIDILQNKIKPRESRAKLPCVCGRKNKETGYGYKDGKEYVVITCPECGLSVKGNSEINAIRAWNKMILSAETVEK